MGRAPSSTTSSTISTARSTPKQNPYSSASKTSIYVIRLERFLNRRAGGGLLITLFTPLFSELVAAGDAFVDPLNLPIDRGSDRAQRGFLEIAQRVGDVPG